MENKLYEILVREETIYKTTVEASSEAELREAFDRGDVKYSEGRDVDSNCEIEQIEEIKK